LPPHLLLARPHRYLEDKFGLRTADEAGKIFFESFDGDHLQFTTAELEGWLDKYFST
jgi:palmitoyl-protein thioesterase